MAKSEVNWGCELSDVKISRGSNSSNSFNLTIPSLTLNPTATGSNKLPIMGISGAGKSTLLNLIGAIEWPHSEVGEINWKFPDGVTIKWGRGGPAANDLKLLRQKYFGFAFQNSTLIPHLNIEENLIYPIQNSGYSRQHALSKARDLLGTVVQENIDVTLKQYPHQLSGGEKQRVSLIQSLVHDPIVLFADEPTGSLDVETRRNVMDVLIKWVDEEPSSRYLIWVTHHADDPQEHNLDRRLSVSTGGCRWENWVSKINQWKIEDSDA